MAMDQSDCLILCKYIIMILSSHPPTSLTGRKLEFRVEFPGISRSQNAGNVKFPAYFVVQGGIG